MPHIMLLLANALTPFFYLFLVSLRLLSFSLFPMLALLPSSLHHQLFLTCVFVPSCMMRSTHMFIFILLRYRYVRFCLIIIIHSRYRLSCSVSRMFFFVVFNRCFALLLFCYFCCCWCLYCFGSFCIRNLIFFLRFASYCSSSWTVRRQMPVVWPRWVSKRRMSINVTHDLMLLFLRISVKYFSSIISWCWLTRWEWGFVAFWGVHYSLGR